MTLIVGIGNAYAGDDSVGLVVAERLCAAGFAAVAAPDVSAIVTLLTASDRVVVVDAVVGRGGAGRVVELSEQDLVGACDPHSADGTRQSARRVSSHGMGIGQALALARAIGGNGCAKDVRVVGITIDPPRAAGAALSAPVAAAVDEAVAVAQRLARD
jgi:hydrogenase maturation protease